MNAVCFNGANDRLIHEADQLISYIERGSSVLKFFPRKRPERRCISVRRETHQVLWSRTNTPQRQAYEGALDIRDIKEVRVGKYSKDFERWPEETKKLEVSKCFTLFYGLTFKLRAVSFAGKFIDFTLQNTSKFNCYSCIDARMVIFGHLTHTHLFGYGSLTHYCGIIHLMVSLCPIHRLIFASLLSCRLWDKSPPRVYMQHLYKVHVYSVWLF